MQTKLQKLSEASKLISKLAASGGTPPIRIPQFEPYSMPPAQIGSVTVRANTLTLVLRDGRGLQVPTVHAGPVCDAPHRERRRCRIVDNGTALEWPTLGYKVTLRQLMGVA